MEVSGLLLLDLAQHIFLPNALINQIVAFRSFLQRQNSNEKVLQVHRKYNPGIHFTTQKNA